MRIFFTIAFIASFIGFSSEQDVSNSSFNLSDYKTFCFTSDDMEFLNSHPIA